MDCPRCRNELRVEKYQGIEVDRCTSCQGMWLEYGELDQLEDTVFDQDELKGSMVYRPLRGDLPCPDCQRPLTAFLYRAYDLELDYCEGEHGVWLDHGEEERVREFMRQRPKDLSRSATAEQAFADFLGRVKSRSFADRIKGWFK